LVISINIHHAPVSSRAGKFIFQTWPKQKENNKMGKDCEKDEVLDALFIMI